MLELRVSMDDAVPPGLRLTLAGLNEADSPAGATDADRPIVPVNPARLLRVMVNVPELPA